MSYCTCTAISFEVAVYHLFNQGSNSNARLLHLLNFTITYHKLEIIVNLIEICVFYLNLIKLVLIFSSGRDISIESGQLFRIELLTVVYSLR